MASDSLIRMVEPRTADSFPNRLGVPGKLQLPNGFYSRHMLSQREYGMV